jgi:hypothetical protein
MNSIRWSWLDGTCTLHRGQQLPCKTCIESNHPDIEWEDSDGPIPLSESQGDHKLTWTKELSKKYSALIREITEPPVYTPNELEALLGKQLDFHPNYKKREEFLKKAYPFDGQNPCKEIELSEELPREPLIDWKAIRPVGKSLYLNRPLSKSDQEILEATKTGNLFDAYIALVKSFREKEKKCNSEGENQA